VKGGIVKHRTHLRARRIVRERWPAPDPSTRVEVENDSAAEATRPKQVRRGDALAIVGLAAIAISIVVALTNILVVPLVSQVAFAALGGVLLATGVVRHRRAGTPRTSVMVVEIEGPPATIDLPSLTGQISGVLGQLRREYGMAYRSRTWIEEMLPAYGADLDDPALARDLLAAAALDAGGIRADLAGLAESHSRDAIVSTGWAILHALQNVLAACEVPTDLLPTPHPSDPSSWPASTC
jgi:hypothetical protein